MGAAQEAVRGGGKVYVHCNGGRGRSAIIVICYLCEKNQWGADQAFVYVRSKRRIASLRKPPPFDRQWRSVKRFLGKKTRVNQVMPASSAPPRPGKQANNQVLPSLPAKQPGSDGPSSSDRAGSAPADDGSSNGKPPHQAAA